MDFVLRHHRKLSEVVPVPEGLRELMADITKEVLRFQPENIEAFIADYLEAMLQSRELSKTADHIVEDILTSTMQIIELLKKEGISTEEARSVNEIIKKEFKDHLDANEPLRELEIVNRLINECHLTVEKAQKASAIIEELWCHFYESKKSKFTSELNNTKLASKSRKSKANSNVQVSSENWQTQNFERREKAALKIQSWYRELYESKRLIKAATVIQTAFRRYKDRRELSLKPAIDKQKLSVVIESPLKIREEEEEAAAKKIQSCFRSYKIRKDLKEHKAAMVIQAHFKAFLIRKHIVNQST